MSRPNQYFSQNDVFLFFQCDEIENHSYREHTDNPSTPAENSANWSTSSSSAYHSRVSSRKRGTRTTNEKNGERISLPMVHLTDMANTSQVNLGISL